MHPHMNSNSSTSSNTQHAQEDIRYCIRSYHAPHKATEATQWHLSCSNCVANLPSIRVQDCVNLLQLWKKEKKKSGCTTQSSPTIIHHITIGPITPLAAESSSQSMLHYVSHRHMVLKKSVPLHICVDLCAFKETVPLKKEKRPITSDILKAQFHGSTVVSKLDHRLETSQLLHLTWAFPGTKESHLASDLPLLPFKTS